MLRPSLALALCLALGACGESRLNPFNWFGGEREERITVDEVSRPADPRALVAEVTALSIEQTSSGAIVTATGLAETQGYWQPGLLEVERGDGAVTYEFRVAPPMGPAVAGAVPTREIQVAVALSARELERLRSITVVGRTNRRSVERR